METESLCLLPTQMLRPMSCNPAYSRGDGVCMCVLCHGTVSLQAAKLQYEQV